MRIPKGVSVESVVANLCDIARFGKNYKSVTHEKRVNMDDVWMAVQKAIANGTSGKPFDVVVESFSTLSIHFYASWEFDDASFDRDYGQGMASLAVSDAIADAIDVKMERRRSCIWKDMDEIR